jgi:hypothetical protein
MDIINLRENHIKPALQDLLGTYTYPNGYTRPAISVGNPQNNLKVSGLEIVLPMLPENEKSIWLSNTIYYEDCWDIRLLQRDGCDNETFLEACNRLRRYFPRSHSNYIPQDTNIGNYPMFVISYRHEDINPVYKP